MQSQFTETEATTEELLATCLARLGDHYHLSSLSEAKQLGLGWG